MREREWDGHLMIADVKVGETGERTKTQRRIEMVVGALQAAAHPEGLTYKELQVVTGTNYQALTYVLTTLEVTGMVRRHRRGNNRGRPTESFSWTMLN